MSHKVFISYSHADGKHLDQLRPFLAPLEQRSLIDLWVDTRIEGGEDWKADIEQALADATVAVLLVTQNFLASEFITREEMPRILRAESEGRLTVLPVFQRPSQADKHGYAFRDAEGKKRTVKLTRLQGFGDPRKGLMKLDTTAREEQYLKLADRLQALVDAPVSPPDRGKEPAEPRLGGSRPASNPVPGAVRLRFRVDDEDGGPGVTFSSDGIEGVSAGLDLDFGPTSRLKAVIDRIENERPDKDDLRDVGSQLWTGLLSGGVEERFEEVCAAASKDRQPFFQIRLDVAPERLARLPWESLYDETVDSFIGTRPQYCILREPGGSTAGEPAERSGGPLSVLVVIPEGSGLEVEREWRNLHHALDPLGSTIRLEGLYGRVTPDRLAEKLREASWDVFHYIGHGVRRDDQVRIRLNDGDETGGERWMDAETFGTLFLDAPVRLAVLNCCLGAAPSSAGSLSGLGPILLRKGIPAVVAMRYEISDDVANHFSRSFYAELLEGVEPGRVDRAMAAARQSIFLNHNQDNVRGFVTPVLYLAEGGERLEGLAKGPPEGRRAAPQPAPAGGAAPSGELPALDPQLEYLLKVISQERCVPILGPGLLQVAGQRSATPAGDRRALILALAEECGYPATSEFQLVEMGGEWLADLVLQRVCQHFLSVKGLFDLVDVVHGVLGGSEPPPELLELARWPTPGILYTTIDGLMAEALRRVGKDVRTINRVDEETEAAEEAPILVHLRGTLAERKSLVVTEEDHDALSQRLLDVNSQIVNLVAGPDRAIVLLGISPQDPLIRRVLHLLLPHGLTPKEGLLFFVRPEHLDVDEAYWARYHARWIDREPAEVIRTVSEHLRRPAS